MKILLDTHIFLWFISGDAQLPTDVRDAIRDPDNEVYLSAVDLFEGCTEPEVLKIKQRSGMLKLSVAESGSESQTQCLS